MNTPKIDIQEVIDHAKVSAFHWQVLICCMLVIIFDGYDLMIYGVALPLIMKQWGLNAVQAGMLASTALFGMMFGAMLFGMLADKIGRKQVIIICLVLFSTLTVLAGFASNPTQFVILRFLAGLGIGGVMPNVTALMAEYSPKKIRSTLVTLMYSGYAIGGMLSALLGAWLVKDFGWQIMFYLAGLPLLLLPVLWFRLPESLVFLVKNQRQHEANFVLGKLVGDHSINNAVLHVSMQQNVEGMPVKALFQQGRALSTIMFWVAFFMCLLMVYALGSWLPKLMLKAGYSLGASMIFLFALNIGGMLGAISGGVLADKFRVKPVLITMFIAGAIALTLLGYKSSPIALYGLIAVAGAATIGAQILQQAMVAQFYPAAARATGLGWALGIGRIGAIAGPVLLGHLLTLALPLQMNFVVVAIPGLIAALAISLVKLNPSSTSQQHSVLVESKA